MTVKTNLPALKCKACGHEGNDYILSEKGVHTKAECHQCGQHIKFLSKQDKYGTKEQQAAIWEKTGGKCCYCGESLNPFEDNGYTIEHMESQNSGGGHETENLYPCCKSCNSSKGKKSLAEYRRYKMKQKNTPTHIFYFEMLKYSDVKHI